MSCMAFEEVTSNNLTNMDDIFHIPPKTENNGIESTFSFSVGTATLKLGVRVTCMEFRMLQVVGPVFSAMSSRLLHTRTLIAACSN